MHELGDNDLGHALIRIVVHQLFTSIALMFMKDILDLDEIVDLLGGFESVKLEFFGLDYMILDWPWRGLWIA